MTGRPPGAEVRIGPWVPAVALRIALAVIGAALALLVLDGLLVLVGAGLAVGAAVLPRSAVPWLLIGLLGLGGAPLDAAGVGPELLLLVAGVHLVAVLSGLALALPVQGRLELAALLAPARRFVLVQVPAQAVALGVLVLPGRMAATPAAAIVGAVVLVVVAVVLVARPRADTG